MIDGTFFVERPSVTFGKGHANGQVAYVVHNIGEGGSFFVPPKANLSDFIGSLIPLLTYKQIQQVITEYTPGFANDSARAGAIVGECECSVSVTLCIDSNF